MPSNPPSRSNSPSHSTYPFSAIAKQPPLAQPALSIKTALSNKVKVQTYLSEPLVKNGSQRKRQGLAMWRAMLDLSLYLNKMQQTRKKQVHEATQEKLQAAYKDLMEAYTALVKEDSSTGHLVHYLKRSGLAALYPNAFTYVHSAFPDTYVTETNEKVPDYKDYLQKMVVMNQVISMSTQLHTDLALPNHKYMAHQMALLYQALSLSGEPLSRHKKTIEGEFESVKETTSANVPNPQLLPRQHQWMSNVTQEVVYEALALRKTATEASSSLESFVRFVSA